MVAFIKSKIRDFLRWQVTEGAKSVELLGELQELRKLQRETLTELSSLRARLARDAQTGLRNAPFGNTHRSLEKPIFVFAQHRGGGTLLTRLLNCHPDIVIWGEHAGFISRLAEADAVMQQYGQVMHPRPDELFERYLARGTDNLADYDPWMSPVVRTDFQAWCREFLCVMFSQRLASDQRWGFKEIRYNLQIAIFLQSLFPDARFVLLARDPIELCLSQLFVSWSLDSLLPTGVQHDAGKLRASVENCLQTIVASQANLASIQPAMPREAISMSYEELSANATGEMGRLFEFLDVEGTSDTWDRISIVAGTVAGATDKIGIPSHSRSDLGLLTRDFVRGIARDLLAGLARL